MSGIRGFHSSVTSPCTGSESERLRPPEMVLLISLFFFFSIPQTSVVSRSAALARIHSIPCVTVKHQLCCHLLYFYYAVCPHYLNGLVRFFLQHSLPLMRKTNTHSFIGGKKKKGQTWLFFTIFQEHLPQTKLLSSGLLHN